MMQSILRRTSRTFTNVLLQQSSLNSHSSLTRSRSRPYFGININLFNLESRGQDSIPGYFLKWGAVGFVRGSRFATGFSPLQPKPLESIIDIDRFKVLSTDDLVSAWDDYHLGRGHIGTAISSQLYHLLGERCINCRHFVIPLPRGNGYTTMFVQVQMPYLLFTGLEDYKARGTQASPYFTVTYYTEFAQSKGLVLVRGDVVLPSKLSDSDARWLIETTQNFYLHDVRYKLVERFNKETREFDFDDVLRALEMPLL
ncbi:hypothetical protein HPP92_017622 [Vanilla planifolia]|uniref:ATP synthase mitochondrial F1 complex assembly factor 1 n=1 Tax=Vanilla planifolia TaxID=51239 RepID=A0A835UM39_VANPL|nr:hypothetical protein HPP92_017622 [Vanilla planifolia]